MAHKKGQGSSKNGRESHSKRLGVKLFGGEVALPGNIIIRQRGTKFHAGEGVKMGKDHTIFAIREGLVSFRKTRKNRNFVSVLPIEAMQEQPAPKPAKKEKPAAKKASPKKEASKKVEEKPAAKKEAETSKKEAAAKGDKLTTIKGVGPAFEKRLNAMGIHTFADMAALTVEKAAELEEKYNDPMTSPETWQAWIDQAKELKG